MGLGLEIARAAVSDQNDRYLSNFHPLPHAIVALQDYFSNTNGILNRNRPQISSGKGSNDGYGTSPFSFILTMIDIQETSRTGKRALWKKNTARHLLCRNYKPVKLVIHDPLYTILTSYLHNRWVADSLAYIRRAFAIQEARQAIAFHLYYYRDSRRCSTLYCFMQRIDG